MTTTSDDRREYDAHQAAVDLVEVVRTCGGQWVVRWKGHGAYLTPPDDAEGTAARRQEVVRLLTEALAVAHAEGRWSVLQEAQSWHRGGG